MTTPQQLRDAGVAIAETGTDDAWRSTADQAIAHLASLGRPFTADTLREELGLPESRSPRALGGRFLAASKAGRIVRVGYRPSARPSVRTSVVAVWIGAERVQEGVA